MNPFGEWLPDQPDFNNPGLIKAKNLIPAAIGYRPIKSLSEISNGFGEADNRIRGIITSQDAGGTFTVFAGNTNEAGGSAKFKKLASSGSWSDVSVAGIPTFSVGAKERWRAIRFGDKTIVSSGHSQSIFAMSPEGTNASNQSITNPPPSPQHLAVVKDFVVCANLSNKQNVVKWSAINDYSQWTIGTNQAGEQAIADSGDVTGIVGGELGVIFLEKAIALMQYVGSPLIFTFDKISNVGCKFPNSIAAISTSQIYFLGEDGFYLFDGARAVPIGTEKIDRHFFADFDPDRADQINCIVDPSRQVVMWSYRSTDASVDVENDSVIIYNYAVNRWSQAKISHDFLGITRSLGRDLDALDQVYPGGLDSMGISLDDPIFKGGVFLPCASKSGKIHTFSGTPLECEIETAELELAPRLKSLVRGVTPYFTTDDLTPQLVACVGSRSRLKDPVVFTDPVTSINSDNFVPLRSHGRYHRFNLKVSGAWKEAIGFDIDAAAMGQR